jgi:hypothetical protein
MKAVPSSPMKFVEKVYGKSVLEDTPQIFIVHFIFHHL